MKATSLIPLTALVLTLGFLASLIYLNKPFTPSNNVASVQMATQHKLTVSQPPPENITQHVPSKVKNVPLPSPNPFVCGADEWQIKYAERHNKVIQQATKTSEPLPDAKYLVFDCSGDCAGLGDRLVGLISSFMLALVTDRIFLINMPAPIPFQEAFVPNKIDWRMPRDRPEGSRNFLEGLSTNTYNNFCKFKDLYHVDLFSQKDLTQELMKDVQVVNYVGNQRFYHFLLDNPKMQEKLKELGMDRMDKFNAFSCLFNYLVKPSQTMQDEIDKFYNDYFVWRSEDNQIMGKNKLICLHVRTGLALKEHVRVPPGQIQYFWNCAEHVESSLIGSGAPVKWYLATDDNQLKNSMLEQKKGKMVAYSTGNIRHVSYEGLDNKEFLSLMVDWTLLTFCDHYIISRSGYSETASMMAQKPRWKFPMDCSLAPKFEFYHPQADFWDI